MLRILFIADSHLGFELSDQPRLHRRRRGHDFLDNYQRALAPAFRGDVDLVVHGGDVFDRPCVSAALAYQALDPLRRIAESGIPVVVVPGNHERARIPHLRFAQHQNVHVFDRPRTFVMHAGGMRVALAGFPYYRRNVRADFGRLMQQTDGRHADADVRLLCIHHCVEGATVGPQNFTFRGASDVIRVNDVPREFAAVLAGHIHRHQVLTRDLRGRAVQVPVFYPGSLERTAFAEVGEAKGYLLLRIPPDRTNGVEWQFERLPTRPFPERRFVPRPRFREKPQPDTPNRSPVIDLFEVSGS